MGGGGESFEIEEAIKDSNVNYSSAKQLNAQTTVLCKTHCQ